ncbi:MAG: 30S ribosomal protein S24e [archaeon]|nr:30S ribosomal protein S24e [archaeon]
MKIKIEEKKDNVLFKRTEICFTIDHDGESTPGKTAVAEDIAKQMKVKKDQVVLGSINSVYGNGKSKGCARIYTSKEDAQKVEPEFILKRNGIQKPVYVAPEKAEK